MTARERNDTIDAWVDVYMNRHPETTWEQRTELRNTVDSCVKAFEKAWGQER